MLHDRILKLLVRPWFARRTIVIVQLVLCWAIVLYLARWGVDDALRRDTANMAWLAIMSITGTYVFGAAWDDRDIRRRVAQISGAAPAEPPPSGS